MTNARKEPGGGPTRNEVLTIESVAFAGDHPFGSKKYLE
jgi:hypothetical protein